MILSVSHLAKSYVQPGATIEVLHDLELGIEKGETVAILGQSGSGKSTLLALLAGLDSPSSGSIQLMQQDLASFDEKQLSRFRARHMGIIFQRYHLMNNLTARENVMLPMELAKRGQAAKKSAQVLEMMGLSHRLDHFPAQLSGGECQRVAIARAFVMQPDLLLADEPSGNLDDRTGQDVMGQLFAMVEKNKSTMILVTHSVSLAEQCQRVLELKSGKLLPHQ